MRNTPRIVLTLLAALALPAAQARAIAAFDGEESGAVTMRGRGPVVMGDPVRQRTLARSAAWRRFESRHGAWRAFWNEATGTPHRAFGRGIALVGYAPEAATVDRAVRRFVSENADLFGTPELRTLAAFEVRGRWYVRYEQTIAGLPVRFADWEFRIGNDGRLFAFGADAQRVVSAPRTTPMVLDAAARAAARGGLAFDPATDRVEGGQKVWVPVTGDDAALRLAYEYEVVTASPPGRWQTWVDAIDGTVLMRVNRIRYAISGTVSGMVHPTLPTDPLASRPMPHLFVTVGGATVTTNAAGFYTASPGVSSTVTARLRGQFCDVNRSDAPDAVFTTTVPDPTPLDIVWNSFNSHDAERDAYVSVNVAHDYVKALDPGFTFIDYIMPTAVNIASTCNAYWNGIGVNFFAAGAGCVNTATAANVVYHEYGHGVNDNLYDQAGASGMSNASLHEGMADIFAAFLEDDPVIGQGFQGIGTSLRTVANTNRWPHDQSGDEHVNGLVIGGAFWDLRQTIGLAAAADLSHFAKYGVPDDPDAGVAMNDFFIETLITDDDDSDLSNGTPNFTAIVDAFNAHGIGTGFFLNVSHTAVADQTSPGGAYPVVASVTYAGPIGALDTASPTLHVAINQGGFASVPMTPTGNPDEYAAPISAPAASIVHYYITAADVYGGINAEPPQAPNAFHTFVVGPATTRFFHDLETDQGWTVGAAGDNATTGIWVRADPVGTGAEIGAVVQPEDDHTPDPGVACYVTGNAAAGQPAGTNDVDGGHTTLTTPVFDATAGGTYHPVIEYYRWFTNNAGANPSEDFWRADLSNDGGASWTPVEATLQTDLSWRRIVFRIEDFMVPTSTMRMRFIADDSGAGGSLVEAAVDDFRLIAFPLTLDAPAGVTPRFALAVGPTPFASRTTLRFSLPTAGPTTLRVYDVGGRAVRTLVEGTSAAGEHAVTWDGRGDGGARVPSGVYFARLEHGGRVVVERLLRME